MEKDKALLADNDLDAVAGGRMNLPYVRPQYTPGPGGGGTWDQPGPNWWANYNMIAHTLP